ncbi:MAG: hypothetical protein F6K62_00445 [Sphaerospermopsis sp. SIO1G2]|nr:hypothetical protein [Sphaerospermopsis sp. SIO1G2]
MVARKTRGLPQKSVVARKTRGLPQKSVHYGVQCLLGLTQKLWKKRTTEAQRTQRNEG